MRLSITRSGERRKKKKEMAMTGETAGSERKNRRVSRRRPLTDERAVHVWTPGEEEHSQTFTHSSSVVPRGTGEHNSAKMLHIQRRQSSQTRCSCTLMSGLAPLHRSKKQNKKRSHPHIFLMSSRETDAKEGVHNPLHLTGGVPCYMRASCFG